jgi:uncharacterized repeat protein (TIGR01451 family)
MKKKKLIIFCMLVFFAFIAMTATNVGAKSLYTIAAINGNPTPIEAYNIEANGSLTFQAGYGVTYYGGGAVGIAIDSDSATLFVTYEFSNTIQLLDATNMNDLGTTTAPGASNLAGIVVDQDKELVYTVDRWTDDLYVYYWYPSNTTLVLKSTQDLTDAPSAFGVALDEINDVLYVADYYQKVMYYDTDTWAKLGEFNVSHYPQSIAMDAINQFVYTGGAWGGSHLITKYDLDTGVETSTSVYNGAMGMAVDPATQLLYCNIGYSQGSQSTIRVFDSDFNQLYLTYFDYSYPSPTGLCIPGKDISFNPLNLSKDDGLERDECIDPGDDINYTICFDNMNEFDVHNVTLVDSLPENLSFCDASGEAVYDSVEHTVTWDLGTLESGISACGWLHVYVDSSVEPDSYITNYVTIDSDETPPTTQSETTHVCNVTVDTTPPTQSLEFGNPKTNREWYGVNYTVVSCSTPLWINSTDPGGVGSMMITYSVWYTDDPVPNENGSIVTEQLYEKTVYDGDPEDIDPANGSISVEIYMEESCFHEIIYQCWDYNENTDGHRDIDFIADCCGPNTTKEVGCPQYGEEYPNWVSCETPLWFDSVDECCLPNGTAVDYIEIKIWWKKNITDLGEPWKLNDTIIVYDEDPEDMNDMKGRVKYELHFDDDCGHEIWWRGVDIFGNKEAWKKQKHKVDCTPPEIMKIVGDPNCEIVAGEEYCVTNYTPIEICAEDRGCMGGVGLEILKYRIWDEEIGWHEWNYVEGECETYYFPEQCKHYLEIYAEDYLGNYIIDNETFYVDDIAPDIDKEVGMPHCPEPGNDMDYVVTTQTPIFVNVTDYGCCDSLIVEISEDGENWTVVPDHYVHYFMEECMHWLYIRAYDCLGHTSWHNESFYVDDYAPEIIKVVGDPNCSSPIGADYCITTQTPIDINVSYGCYPEFVVQISENGEGWTNIDVPYTFNFSKECYHELYIRAWDCMGRMDYDYEEFFVDDTAPIINKTVGTPNCTDVCGADYVVTTSTPIYVNTTDPGCCPSLTVEISEDGENWTVVPDHYVHYFAEECMHWLYIRAYDCLGHITWHNESFYVDDYAPEISKIVGDPQCIPEEGADFCVKTTTPIDINVSYGCYPEFSVQISEDGENWTGISVPYTHNFNEECYHELYIRAWDCMGRMNYDNETFFVDDTPPAWEKNIGDPKFYMGKDKYGHDQWLVTTDTEINLTADDEGCCNLPAYIFYRISVQGYWSEWKEYTGNFTFKEGCTHWLEVNFSDCLGNYVIDNETFIIHGSNGPHIEIIAPEDDEELNSRESKYAHVKIKGWYADDQNDHNITVTCWLDNPYGAPDLYYPVEWNNSENCFTSEIDIYKYSTGSTLQLVAKGEDEYGGREYDDVSFTVNTTVDYDKWMEEGWNGPINIAVLGCDTSVECVFSSILDDAYAVFEVGTWKDYKFHAPYKGGNLQTIDSSKWYWISMMNASRFFIDSNPPTVEITTPLEGDEITELCEVSGTAHDIETGVKHVTLMIFDHNTSEYWDGSIWQGASYELMCTGTEDWDYPDSMDINWTGREGHMIYLTATATDMAGCYATDEIWVTIADEEEVD